MSTPEETLAVINRVIEQQAAIDAIQGKTAEFPATEAELKQLVAFGMVAADGRCLVSGRELLAAFYAHRNAANECPST